MRSELNTLIVSLWFEQIVNARQFLVNAGLFLVQVNLSGFYFGNINYIIDNVYKLL